MEIAERKKAIANSEWHVRITLHVGDDAAQVGGDLTLQYADSYLAKMPNEVGRLIGAAMQERAIVLTPKKARRR